jgi:RimJ/RimL family protein N-acetyltransferase
MERMKTDLFTGELVRLVTADPETAADVLSRWGQDSEYLRLLDNDPARMFSVKKFKEWLEKDFVEAEPLDNFLFLIQTLAEEQLIGFVGLDGVRWNHGDCYVGIGLGGRENWGKGYGTDAMRLVLRYAFDELNLHRVSLGVFEYNPRAIRSYEKAGFIVEGRARQFLHRDGRRWDLIFMGILREEWEKARGNWPVTHEKEDE